MSLHDSNHSDAKLENGIIKGSSSNSNLPTGMTNYFNSICNSKHYRFYILVTGILVSFGLHNYMQELIMRQPGFAIGVILGYLEVLGMTICSYLEILATVIKFLTVLQVFLSCFFPPSSFAFFLFYHAFFISF